MDWIGGSQYDISSNTLHIPTCLVAENFVSILCGDGFLSPPLPVPPRHSSPPP
jgi:hypothetical protein